jgi:hypothetical protein
MQNSSMGLAERYLGSVSRPGSDGYVLSAEEVGWLVSNATRTSRLRLELLRSLQTALPRSEADEAVSELKEMLTNLIIMQTRLAEREDGLLDLLSRAIGTGALKNLTVDEYALRDGIGAISEAIEHFETVAGG